MSKLIIGLYVLATSLALVVLKLGTDKSGAPVHFNDGKLAVSLNWYVFTGILMYGVSFLLYIFLISKYDLGYIIPLTTALVYVSIFTASYFIFNEAFTAFKIAGIVLIIAGLTLLNIKK